MRASSVQFSFPRRSCFDVILGKKVRCVCNPRNTKKPSLFYIFGSNVNMMMRNDRPVPNLWRTGDICEPYVLRTYFRTLSI